MCLGSVVEATSHDAQRMFTDIKTVFPQLETAASICSQPRELYVAELGENWTKQAESLLRTFDLHFGMTDEEIIARWGTE